VAGLEADLDAPKNGRAAKRATLAIVRFFMPKAGDDLPRRATIPVSIAKEKIFCIKKIKKNHYIQLCFDVQDVVDAGMHGGKHIP
jgi:hypothetical protein